MKRLLTLLALVLCSCAETFVGEEIARQNNENLPDLTAAFAVEDNTRTYIEDGKYLRWHEDDRLTIFYGNTLNRQYKFNGATGDNSGTFSLVPDGMLGTGNAFDCIYALYPYNTDARITDEGIISLTLPAEQTYAENSFGRGANTMLAVTENLEDTFLAFKNACGYLKLKLYNAEGSTIKSIEVKGNSGERLAGAATATIVFGEAPIVTMAESATDTITLNCGEGVALGTTAETATEFWFVLPATTFAEGLTITATDTEGKVFKKSTTKEVVIERNHIQPMASVEHNAEYTLPLKQIKYGANSKIELDHWCFDTFGANIVSHEYDETTNMHTITFDDVVTTIGDYAFSECYDLMYIIIHENVTSIGKYAFANSQLMAIDIWGDSINYIGDYAFYRTPVLNSTSLNKIIGSQKDLRYIGDYAFGRCNSAGLQHLILPENLTIGDYAFDYNNCITAIYCTSSTPNKIGTLYLGEDGYIETTIYVPLGSENEYKNAEGWSELRDNIYGYDFNKTTTISFKSEYGLEPYLPIVNFTYEDGVGTVEFLGDGTIIPAGSFCNSTITEITLPHNVTTIGDYAFSSCYRLTSATIPDSVTEIGDYAFSSCYRLTSVTIPDSVTTIGDSAFYGCSRLESATIPDSVTTIGNAAFYECRSLTSVTIPDSVTAIGEKAFCTCSHLTTLVIGSNVKEIGYYAFGNCGSLSDVYCKALVPPITDGYPFDYNSSFSTIYVPTESVDVYQHTKYWWNWLFEGYNF